MRPGQQNNSNRGAEKRGRGASPRYERRPKGFPPEAEETGDQHPPISEHRRYGSLLGFLAKAEVDAIFKQQPFKTVRDEDPIDVWRRFDQQRQMLEPASPGAIAALPHNLRELEDEVRARKTFRQYYEAVADYQFGLVPLRSLLSPQWPVDLDYVEELAGQLSAQPSEEELFRFALCEGSIHQPVIAGNQVLFTTSRRDLHADHIPEVRQTNSDEYEIIVRASSRPNYVNVAVLEGRLLLTNGVHKVCALLRLGMTHTFCAYRGVDTFADTGIMAQTSLFRDAIFKSPRPALVADFMDPRTSAPLYIRSMNQILQVAVTVGTMTIPALPQP